MIQITFVNHTDSRIPKAFIKKWIYSVYKKLPSHRGELVIVYVNAKEMKKINFKYRGKNTVTDILSFEGINGQFGELVLCPEVLKKQAKEHGLSFRLELGYYLLHGWLHLLGYDHVGHSKAARAQAKKMFRLQDQVFEDLRSKVRK